MAGPGPATGIDSTSETARTATRTSSDARNSNRFCGSGISSRAGIPNWQRRAGAAQLALACLALRAGSGLLFALAGHFTQHDLQPFRELSHSTSLFVGARRRRQVILRILVAHDLIKGLLVHRQIRLAIPRGTIGKLVLDFRGAGQDLVDAGVG